MSKVFDRGDMVVETASGRMGVVVRGNRDVPPGVIDFVDVAFRLEKWSPEHLQLADTAEAALPLGPEERAIARLAAELDCAYRCIRGLYQRHLDSGGSAQAFHIHLPTIAAAVRFVETGDLGGLKHFIGKPVSVLQETLALAKPYPAKETSERAATTAQGVGDGAFKRFTVEETSLRKVLPLAIVYGAPPTQHADGSTHHSLRFPVLCVTDLPAEPQAFLEKVAAVLNASDIG